MTNFFLTFLKQEYFYRRDSPSVPLEFPKLATAQPSNFGPLRIFFTKTLRIIFCDLILIKSKRKLTWNFEVICCYAFLYSSCQAVKRHLTFIFYYLLISLFVNDQDNGFKTKDLCGNTPFYNDVTYNHIPCMHTKTCCISTWLALRVY